MSSGGRNKHAALSMAPRQAAGIIGTDLTAAFRSFIKYQSGEILSQYFQSDIECVRGAG